MVEQHYTSPLLALAPLYEAAKNVPKRVEVLEARANLEEDDAVSADLYVKAAALNSKGRRTLAESQDSHPAPLA